MARRIDDPPTRERDYPRDREGGFVRERERVYTGDDRGARRPLGRRGPLGLDPMVLVLGGLALVALLALAVYLANDRNRVADDADGPSVAAIADEPAAFYGKEVTIDGEVVDSLGPRAFVLGEREGLDTARVLVLGAAALPVAEGRSEDAPFLDDDEVQVSGMVRPFRQDELERELGFDLDDAVFADWENEPTLVATSVQLVR
jgi:hypothetical protein